jgi:hypothetical protein
MQGEYWVKVVFCGVWVGIVAASITAYHMRSLFSRCQPLLSQKMTYQTSLAPGSSGVIPPIGKK